ncbi:hypothetical protein L6164_012567 [Bauhinia variegata]|uniref:Uncharacterized protein n=1 Tax=Bauhinia variegata TaxID=167791 RepID=A0ACB9P9Y4_BAUVA|nr:hypothetical protein L6164_012567 [Bauhinia variegata]
MKMEENAELEEGEAPYHRDDDHNIDLDSLSYIGERINNLLGHFRKDFEGAKFDGYGSFLPNYECSPSQSHPKTPQRNHSSPKSHNNICMEADSRNSKGPPNAPPSIRHGAAFCSAHSFQNLGLHSVDDSMKQDIGISSYGMTEICPSKDDRTKKSGCSTDQRRLKFRIKVNSDKLALKNAAIYSGLGLDNSPSSSMGNSNEEGGGMPPVSRDIDDESLTGIIKDMTSFPTLGGVLISPLHGSLLYLIEKGEILGASRSMSSINDHQEHCFLSTDESDSCAGDGKLLKKREVRNVGQSEKKLESKYTNSNDIENDMNLHAKKRVGSKTPERKEFLSNGLKCTPLSSSVCDAGESAEVTCKFSEVSNEVNKDGVKGQMGLIEAMREEALESIFGQDFDKSEKQCLGNSYAEKSLEHKRVNSQEDNSTYLMYNGKCKADKISKKAEHDVIKFKADQDPQKHKTNQKGKPSVEGKNKIIRDQSPSKFAVSKKDSSGACNNAKKSAGSAVASIKSKMHKTKSLKDNNVREGKRDSLKGKKSEWAVNEMHPVNGLPGHIPISAGLDTYEERNEYGVKRKERPSVNKLNSQLIARPFVEDDLNADSISGNKLALEMVPSAAAAPLVIEENWVCCDSCEKWRLLPLGTKSDWLPENWLCGMLDWLPGMNCCEIPEDETTNVMRALHQKQISEGQSNLQNQATGTATGVSSGDTLQTGLNHQNPRSDVLSDQGKKKHGFMGKTKAGSSSDLFLISNSTKNNAQESGKNRSLTNMNHHPSDLNPLKKSSAKHLSKLHSSVSEKNMPKEKENLIYGGNRKLIKLKRKIDTDQHSSGTTKKSKTEDLCYASEQLDLEKVGLNSRNGLPMMASGKDMRKYDEYCLSEDGKHKLVVSVKKQGENAQFLSDGGSLEVTNNSKGGDSYKKRKLKDWKDSIKHNVTCFLQDGKPYEENIVSGFRKEKKYKVLNAEAKSVIELNDNLNSEGRVNQVCFSSSRDHLAVGTEVRSVDKAQQRRKQSEKVAFQQVSDSIDPLGRDGCRQLSLAATSSSSKVSGSHKARTNFEDVKGSPVESVTSSPVRTSNLDRLQLVGRDTQGKDTAARGGLSLMGSKRSMDNKEAKQPIKTRKRVSYDLHSETHKFSSIESLIGDAKDKAKVLATTSSKVRNDDLLNGGVGGAEQHNHYANVPYHVDKVSKKNQETSLSRQKSDEVMSLWGNEERRSDSEFDKGKMKVSALENGYSKNGRRYKSASELSHHVSGHETRNDSKNNSPNNSTAKRNSVRHSSNGNGKKTELKQEDTENSVLKVDPCSTNRKILNEQNLIQGLEEKNKADPACTESIDGKSKVLSSLEGKEKRGKIFVDSKTALRSLKGDMSLHASGNGDITKIIESTVDACGKDDSNPCSGNFGSDRQLTVSSPVIASSSQTAFDTLKEAGKLKDRAKSYKNSGFGFESKETYFEAALKFLHGASVLENYHSESSKHGERSPMQIYSSTAKMLESCANEYEKDGERATAALVYKCMEVAYLRLVYCKNSSTMKDWQELQSTLQMVPQGESPSSSASDVDNLNNQGAVDHKATLLKGTGIHGNQVISTRSRPSVIRIFDFTGDMILAMEASRKCWSAFEAGNRIMEDARNKDCINSIRSVINSSFQNVDELVRLVWIARKDISRARD